MQAHDAQRGPRHGHRRQGDAARKSQKLWAYIKKNGLQDKKNKRMINADPALKTVFGGKATVSMFEMTKLVSKHLK